MPSTLYPDIMAATKGNVGAVENMTALPKLITVFRMLLLPSIIAKGTCQLTSAHMTILMITYPRRHQSLCQRNA